MATDKIECDFDVIRQFVIASAFWGIVAFFVGVYITLQSANPILNWDVSWLSFGRLRPLHTSAAIMAFASHHPPARALAAMSPGNRTVIGVEEVPGLGLRLDTNICERRLGSRTWCDVEDEDTSVDPEFWFVRPGHSPVRFRFRDQLRGDTVDTL
jgi:hypothetical protein